MEKCAPSLLRRICLRRRAHAIGDETHSVAAWPGGSRTPGRGRWRPGWAAPEPNAERGRGAAGAGTGGLKGARRRYTGRGAAGAARRTRPPRRPREEQPGPPLPRAGRRIELPARWPAAVAAPVRDGPALEAFARPAVRRAAVSARPCAGASARPAARHGPRSAARRAAGSEVGGGRGRRPRAGAGEGPRREKGTAARACSAVGEGEKGRDAGWRRPIVWYLLSHNL